MQVHFASALAQTSVAGPKLIGVLNLILSLPLWQALPQSLLSQGLLSLQGHTESPCWRWPACHCGISSLSVPHYKVPVQDGAAPGQALCPLQACPVPPPPHIYAIMASISSLSISHYKVPALLGLRASIRVRHSATFASVLHPLCLCHGGIHPLPIHSSLRQCPPNWLAGCPPRSRETWAAFNCSVPCSMPYSEHMETVIGRELSAAAAGGLAGPKFLEVKAMISVQSTLQCTLLPVSANC